MISLQDLMGYLEALFPTEGVADYGPNGLQVEGKERLSKIATAVSASVGAIDAARDWGADALIVHHGLFWGNKPTRIVAAMQRKVKALLDAGISLIGYHLPMDAHQTVGNNWPAAEALGMRELEPFGRHNGMELGVRGRAGPIAIEDWIAKLEGFYDHKAHTALGGPQEVKKVALLSGGGHKFLEEAIACGVDCLVTGSFDEPQWHMALDDKIHFIAMGHHATERVGPRALATQLAKRFSMETQFIDTENPF